MNAGLCTLQGTLVPLLGVEVRGEVLGGHARILVRQRYKNAESRPIEAIYVFPLPADAALTGFVLDPLAGLPPNASDDSEPGAAARAGPRAPPVAPTTEVAAASETSPMRWRS